MQIDEGRGRAVPQGGMANQRADESDLVGAINGRAPRIGRARGVQVHRAARRTRPEEGVLRPVEAEQPRPDLVHRVGSVADAGEKAVRVQIDKAVGGAMPERRVLSVPAGHLRGGSAHLLVTSDRKRVTRPVSGGLKVDGGRHRPVPQECVDPAGGDCTNASPTGVTSTNWYVMSAEATQSSIDSSSANLTTQQRMSHLPGVMRAIMAG